MYAVRETSIGVVCEILQRRNKVEERLFVNWVMWCFQVNLLSRVTSKNLNDLPSSFSFKENMAVSVFSRLRHRLMSAK